MDKIKLVSPDGEEHVMDNLPFLVKGYTNNGWKVVKENSRKGRASGKGKGNSAPDIAHPPVPDAPTPDSLTPDDDDLIG